VNAGTCQPVRDDAKRRILERIDLVALIGERTALTSKAGHSLGLCPFHAEKSGSFNVREETGRYKCFGCSASGDVFKFVQEIEHLDFMAAVERLANRVGIQLTYTSATDTKDRQRRKRMIDVMEQAVSWYHDRLLSAPDARAARDYLRGRGLAGDVAREFRLGWAPDDWDQLSKSLKVDRDLLVDCGLAFVNKRGNLQDSFRGRLLLRYRCAVPHRKNYRE
jgi:DNA primase